MGFSSLNAKVRLLSLLLSFHLFCSLLAIDAIKSLPSWEIFVKIIMDCDPRDIDRWIESIGDIKFFLGREGNYFEYGAVFRGKLIFLLQF